MFFSIGGKGSEEERLRGSTLIIPILSIGNVSQLAVDLLIANLPCERVGFLDDAEVLPLVGNDAFATSIVKSDSIGQISTAVEVFYLAESNITIIQQRSPIRKNGNGKYLNRLMEWIGKVKFSRVLAVLVGDSSFRTDTYLQTDRRTSHLHPNSHQEIRYISVTDKFPPPSDWQSLSVDEEHNAETLFPRGSFAKLLLSSLTAAEIPSLFAITFVAEGVNIVESQQLAAWLYTAATNDEHHQSVNPSLFKQPLSWSKSILFGAPIEESLY
jgi:proteasome assembly chaperone 2